MLCFVEINQALPTVLTGGVASVRWVERYTHTLLSFFLIWERASIMLEGGGESEPADVIFVQSFLAF